MFVDETMYCRLGMENKCSHMLFDLRTSLGSCGCPYHLYLIDDFSQVNLSAYKAAVFAIPDTSNQLASAKITLSALNIPFLHLKNENCFPSAQLLGSFFESCGAWRYLDSNDVLYAGNGFIAVHASAEGAKMLRLPEEIYIRQIGTDAILKTDCLKLNMQLYETVLFELI